MNLESRVYLKAPFSVSGRKGGIIFRSRCINEKGNKSSSFFRVVTSGDHLAQQLTWYHFSIS